MFDRISRQQIHVNDIFEINFAPPPPHTHAHAYVQRIDYALSRESRLHSSPDGSGFLQIPLADAKELYAIKFRDTVDGDAFYAKIVNEMGEC